MHNNVRVLENDISDKVVAIEHRESSVDFAEIHPLVADKWGQAALKSNNVNKCIVIAGQVVGLIDDIPIYAELIDRIVTDCYKRLSVE